MKKYKKIGAIVLIIILIILIYNKNRYVSKDTRDEFLKYLDDYNTMAEIYYKDYQHYRTGILRYSDGESGVIYCYSYNSQIVLSDNEMESCKNACESYQYLIGRSIDKINAYDGFVSFGIPNGRKALVYSAEDKRPSCINDPDDGFKHVIVEKITDHWYYVYCNGWY